MMKYKVPQSLIEEISYLKKLSQYRKDPDTLGPFIILVPGPFGHYELEGIPDEELTIEVPTMIRVYKE